MKWASLQKSLSGSGHQPVVRGHWWSVRSDTLVTAALGSAGSYLGLARTKTKTQTGHTGKSQSPGAFQTSEAWATPTPVKS